MALTRCFCLFKRATIHVMWLLLKSFIFEDINDKWENNWYFCCHVKYFLFKKNVLSENHLFWFCLLPKKWCLKRFPFFFLLFSSLISCIQWRKLEKNSQLGQIIPLWYALTYSTTWNMLTYKYYMKNFF